MISSSQNHTRLSNWVLVIQGQWNAWEPWGRRLVFTHAASLRWVGADTGRISAHRMTGRRRLPHTLGVMARRSLTPSVNARTWISPKAAGHKSHQQKATIFHVQSQTAPQAKWRVCISVYLDSISVAWKETKRKEGNERILSSKTVLIKKNNNCSFSTFQIHFSPKWFHSTNLTQERSIFRK